MAETIKDAVMYIEQGHVKVGVDTVTDPAFHVTRSMEDHITWVRTSKIAAKVKNYRSERDDFEIFEWSWTIWECLFTFKQTSFWLPFN